MVEAVFKHWIQEFTWDCKQQVDNMMDDFVSKHER